MEDAVAGRLAGLVERRVAGEPLQYVLGRWGFRRLELAVDPRVLIPRPETEVLAELALAACDRLGARVVVDLGTGSGALALALATERADLQVWATDVSGEALEVAEANRAALGAGVNLVQGSWYEALPADVRGVGGRDRVQPAVRVRGGDARARARGAGLGARGGAVRRSGRAGGRGRGHPGGAGVAGAAGGAAGGDGAAPDPAGGAAWHDAGFGDVEIRKDLAGRRAGAGGAVVRPDLVPVDETGEAVKLAVAALTAGQVVALPTDTVYGLAALPGDPDHTAKLFALKGRGHDVPVAVLCSDLEQALALADRERMPAGAHRIAERLWPGPLTLVLPRKAGLGYALGRPEETIGVRCPDHDLVRALAPRGRPAGHHQRQPARRGHAAHGRGGGRGVRDRRWRLVLDGGPCAEPPSVGGRRHRPGLARPEGGAGDSGRAGRCGRRFSRSELKSRTNCHEEHRFEHAGRQG